MNLREIFEQEIKKNNLNWCKGECDLKSSHKRGFVMLKDKTTVHLDSKICTRASLHRGLHEIGHCLDDEKGLRSYEQEAKAEKFATDKMREYGVSVPRKTILKGRNYVKRKKRHGDRIRRSRRK